MYCYIERDWCDVCNLITPVFLHLALLLNSITTSHRFCHCWETLNSVTTLYRIFMLKLFGGISINLVLNLSFNNVKELCYNSVVKGPS